MTSEELILIIGMSIFAFLAAVAAAIVCMRRPRDRDRDRDREGGREKKRELRKDGSDGDRKVKALRADDFDDDIDEESGRRRKTKDRKKSEVVGVKRVDDYAMPIDSPKSIRKNQQMSKSVSTSSAATASTNSAGGGARSKSMALDEHSRDGSSKAVPASSTMSRLSTIPDHDAPMVPNIAEGTVVLSHNEAEGTMLLPDREPVIDYRGNQMQHHRMPPMPQHNNGGMGMPNHQIRVVVNPSEGTIIPPGEATMMQPTMSEMTSIPIAEQMMLAESTNISGEKTSFHPAERMMLAETTAVSMGMSERTSINPAEQMILAESTKSSFTNKSHGKAQPHGYVGQQQYLQPGMAYGNGADHVTSGQRAVVTQDRMSYYPAEQMMLAERTETSNSDMIHIPAEGTLME